MPPLAAIERFFERIFERPTARFFRTRLQPVQLQRRIERAMESERLAARDRTLVPNRYTVHLNPVDLEGFGEFGSTLAAELADSALVFARAHHYTLVDRPRVELIADPTVDRADIVVRARFADPVAGRTVEPVALGAGADPAEDPATNTMVFTVPQPQAPHARLRLIQRGSSERVIDLDGRTMTLGRATDNGLVLADGRVSRHHGRISVRRGTLVYTDLGSTNGSRVNGTPVDEVVLGVGDRIQVGDTLLVIEAVEAGGHAVRH
jgi:FhaA, N-terminal domain/FHA domain